MSCLRFGPVAAESDYVQETWLLVSESWSYIGRNEDANTFVIYSYLVVDQ